MRRNCYIVFTDLKGYSKLVEEQVLAFQRSITPVLAAKFGEIRKSAVTWNTWGDAIFAAFEDADSTVDFLLKYRDFFRQPVQLGGSTTTLLPRIAAHFAEIEVVDDPILGGVNVVGIAVNAASRIEPVTRPGEVFVTRDFKEQIERNPSATGRVQFDELGTIALAKNFGDRDVFRLRRIDEDEQIIDRVTKQDLSTYLPEPPQITDEEERRIEYIRMAPSISEATSHVLDIDRDIATPGMLVEGVQLLVECGEYQQAVAMVAELEGYSMEVEGITLHPMRHNRRLLKLKANALTRLSRYDEAADIVYGIWQSGACDSDSLSMIAAQYKRRALFGQNESIVKDDINYQLLHRAKNLYIEAFRKNIEDYYPAINAAYLYRMLGGSEKGRGTKLAAYIATSWRQIQGENWWIDATLAEAELLVDDFERALPRFEEALERHKPSVFERESTRTQILSYSTVSGLADELAEITGLLYTAT
jgi:class 3 adenylate cyclase